MTNIIFRLYGIALPLLSVNTTAYMVKALYYIPVRILPFAWHIKLYRFCKIALGNNVCKYIPIRLILCLPNLLYTTTCRNGNKLLIDNIVELSLSDFSYSIVDYLIPGVTNIGCFVL